MKPGVRHRKVAMYLAEGFTKSEACTKAGFSPSYVKAFSKRIVESMQVKQALLELGQEIKPGELGTMAKALLQKDLIKPPKGDKGAKTRLSIIRTGLEADGMIGGPSEMHLHQHTTLPPSVQKMLEDKMREILASKEEAIDGTVVSEGATSEGQNQENHDGVQGGESPLRFQIGAISEVAGTSDCD